MLLWTGCGNKGQVRSECKPVPSEADGGRLILRVVLSDYFSPNGHIQTSMHHVSPSSFWALTLRNSPYEWPLQMPLSLVFTSDKWFTFVQTHLTAVCSGRLSTDLYIENKVVCWLDDVHCPDCIFAPHMMERACVIIPDLPGFCCNISSFCSDNGRCLHALLSVCLIPILSRSVYARTLRITISCLVRNDRLMLSF